MLRCSPAGFDVGSDRDGRDGWCNGSTLYLINIKFFAGCGACGYVGEGELPAFRACSGSGGSAAGRRSRSFAYPQAFLVNLPRRAVTEALVPALRIVQLGAVTPTVPKSERSARFFIPGIPGLDALSLSMTRCLPIRIGCDPHVALAALAELKELLAEAAGRNGQPLSSNTPVSSAASEARDQNRGNAHAISKSTSRDRPPASPAARSIRSAGPGGLRSAGPVVASAAGRDTSGGDGDAGAAPARSRPCRSLSDPDAGGR